MDEWHTLLHAQSTAHALSSAFVHPGCRQARATIMRRVLQLRRVALSLLALVLVSLLCVLVHERVTLAKLYLSRQPCPEVARPNTTLPAHVPTYVLNGRPDDLTRKVLPSWRDFQPQRVCVNKPPHLSCALSVNVTDAQVAASCRCAGVQ